MKEYTFEFTENNIGSVTISSHEPPTTEELEEIVNSGNASYTYGTPSNFRLVKEHILTGENVIISSCDNAVFD